LKETMYPDRQKHKNKRMNSIILLTDH